MNSLKIAQPFKAGLIAPKIFSKSRQGRKKPWYVLIPFVPAGTFPNFAASTPALKRWAIFRGCGACDFSKRRGFFFQGEANND
jgi:hypothetical protein